MLYTEKNRESVNRSRQKKRDSGLVKLECWVSKAENQQLINCATWIGISKAALVEQTLARKLTLPKITADIDGLIQARQLAQAGTVDDLKAIALAEKIYRSSFK